MSTADELILKQLKAIPDVASKLGVFVRMNGPLAVVNVGKSIVSIPVSGFYSPIAGMSVQLERRNGSLIVTGPSKQLPALGVMTSSGTPKATVLAGGIEYTLGMRDTYTPTIGDDVEINWFSGLIQGKVKGLTVVAAPIENPPAGSTPFSNLRIMAETSGSYISRWWTNDVYNGDSNTGAWFYGARVADGLRGATIKKIEIFLNPRQVLYGPPQVGTHTSGSKSGGNVTVSNQIALEPRSGWVEIPVSWAAVLQAGGGIGVTPSGYTIWRGTGSDALSGALRFSGTR
jgi:hypothetical protein